MNIANNSFNFLAGRFLKGNFSRGICSTNVNYLLHKWCEERGLPTNPNSSGVLTDSPDYSFLDGRPTPYGKRQRIRLIKHKQYTEKILELTAEVDFAVERHKQLCIEKELNKKRIIESKLKSKGAALVKSK